MTDERNANDSGEGLPTRHLPPSDPPTGPFVLSLVSGVLILLGALMPLVFIGRFSGMSDMMGVNRAGWIFNSDSLLWRILGLGFGGLVLYGAYMLNARPRQHATWGIIVLIFAALSPFGAMGGFGIGMLAGLIGGAWAIIWKPSLSKSSMPSAARFCPQCGRSIHIDARFCSHCGYQLPA